MQVATGSGMAFGTKFGYCGGNAGDLTMTDDIFTGLPDLATKSDLSELKYDLVKWIVGLVLAQMALLAGIVIKLM